MRIPLRLWLALLVSLVAGSTAVAAVTVADIRDADVVVEEGTPYGAEERSRLEREAADLRAKDFPAKFVVVRDRMDDPDEVAFRLRRELAGQIGLEKIDGVFVLGPRQLGISAGLQAERTAAFEAERATLQDDPIQGTINVARRLQDCDARIALGDECGFLDRPVPATSKGLSGGLLALLIGVVAIGAVAFAFARRAAKRGEKRRAHEQEREVFAPMLDVLSSQIVDLGDEVAGPGRERARVRYDEAVTAYGEVRDALAQGDEWDGDAMRGRIRDGIRSALAARALIDGKPEQTDGESILSGLCAFDPKHGRAAATRRITTPSGDGAQVPVCMSCAAGLDRGETPALRLVSIGGSTQPYWRIQGMGDMFGSGMSDSMAAMIEEALQLAATLTGGGGRRP